MQRVSLETGAVNLDDIVVFLSLGCYLLDGKQLGFWLEVVMDG